MAKNQKPNNFVAKPRPDKLRVVNRQVSASVEQSITGTKRQEITNQANGSEGLELITIDDDEEHLEQEEEAPNQQNCSFILEVERDYDEVISSSQDDSVDILLNDSNSLDDSVDILLDDSVDGDPVTKNSFGHGQIRWPDSRFLAFEFL